MAPIGDDNPVLAEWAGPARGGWAGWGGAAGRPARLLQGAASWAHLSGDLLRGLPFCRLLSTIRSIPASGQLACDKPSETPE